MFCKVAFADAGLKIPELLFGIECFKYSNTLELGGNIFIRVFKIAGSFWVASGSFSTGKIMFLS